MNSSMDTLSRSTKSAFPNSGLSCSAMVSPVPPVKVKRPKWAGMRRRQKGGHGPVLRGQLLPARCGFSSSKLLLHSWLLSLLWPNHKKNASEKDANSAFSWDRTSTPEHPKVPRSRWKSPPLSRYAARHLRPFSWTFSPVRPHTSVCQSERSSLSETTPPPRGEVWVSPETTERLFPQHSWTMTGPPLWAAAYPEKGKKKGFFFKDARPYHKRKKNAKPSIT